VRRAALMHEDVDVRVLLDDRADRSRVIEVNVRQQDLAHVFPPDPLPAQGRRQRRHGRRRAGIHEGDAGRAVKDGGSDDLRTSEEVQVDVVDAGSKHGHDGHLL